MRYYIVHNTIEAFSYGEILEEQVVTTGYSNIEYFENMLSFTQRLSDFGIVYNVTEELPTDFPLESDTE